MKKLAIFLLISLGLLLILPTKSFAASPNGFGFCNSSTASTSSVCQDANNGNSASNPVINIIRIVIDVVSIILGLVAVVIIIISGLRMVLGGSDPNTINNSRTAILYAVIGIVVAVFAQAIVVFVLDRIH